MESPTTGGNKIRLLIADDHEVVRSGLKTMLAGTEVKVVAEVASGAAAVKYALENEVDVVLLDIRMPDGDGLTALGRIKLDKPDMPVLILSTFDNPTYVARAVAFLADPAESGFINGQALAVDGGWTADGSWLTLRLAHR